MKRFLAVLLVLGLCLSFAGCDVLDYKDAMDLYEAGQFAEAYDIFSALGDYADSQAMAAICKQKVDYAAAEEFFAAADFRSALPLYTSLEMYKDSPVKAIVCQYEIGLDCIEAGAYEEALSWLEPLGSYEDCPELVLKAKWLWVYDYVKTNGGIEHVINAEDAETVRLEANDDGTLTLRYTSEGYLLGVPFENEFAMILTQGSDDASYSAHCVSTLVNVIDETAGGTVSIGGFTANSPIDMESFLQTITDKEGAVTTMEDPDEALMVNTLLLSIRIAISDTLPTLLESTGADITVSEFGFLSLE